ncbi:MAG: TlpA family protein disulfide reductase [Pirellulaceae bacterium]
MKRNIVFLLLISLVTRCAIAEDAPSKPVPNTAEEQELMDMVSDLQTKLVAHFEEMAKITDGVEQARFFAQHDAAREAIPKLLAFEERQRGTHPGLMSLGVIVGLAASSGELEGARYSGRREALKRLPRYANQIELTDILRLTNSGAFEPRCEQLFRALGVSPDADASVRDFSKLMFAEWLLGWKHGREYTEQRIRELDQGAEPQFPTERKFFAERLAVLPNAAQMKDWEKEAVELLRVVTKSDQALRRPAVQREGPQYCLVRFDAELTKTMPRLSEMAEGMLFKELHLQVGRDAPDFKVGLVSGNEWVLSAQQGKVVIIQFSFKGCGPCEEMYPDLQAIQKEYGPKVSILSVMADEKQSTAEEAVKLGKLTWDVHWDGFRGPLATRWAVSYHPTVYVLDSKGFVAGQDLRGKQLKQKVAELAKRIDALREPPP